MSQPKTTKESRLLASSEAAKANFSTDSVFNGGCMECGCELFIRYHYDDGAPVPNAPFTVTDSRKKKIKCQTDAEGLCKIINLGCGGYTVDYEEGSDEFALQEMLANNPSLQNNPANAALIGEYFTLFATLSRKEYLTYDADDSSDDYIDVDGSPFTNIPDEYEAAYDRFWEIHEQIQDGPVSLRIAANKIYTSLAGETAELTMFNVAVQFLAEVALGMVPVVGQGKDLYDISLWCYDTYEGKEGPAHWIEGLLNVIGIFPGVGDGIKVIGRTVIRALRHSNLRLIQQAGKVIRSLSNGNIIQYLENFSTHLDDAIKGMKPYLDEILVALEKAVVNSKGWIMMLVKEQFAGMVEVLAKLKSKLSGIAADLKAEVAKFVAGYKTRKSAASHSKGSQVEPEQVNAGALSPNEERAFQTQHAGENGADPEAPACTAGVCKRKGEPIDMLTGKAFESRIDFQVPGMLPLVHERYYHSTGRREKGLMGSLWRSSWDISLHLDNNQAVFIDKDHTTATFMLPYTDIPSRSVAKPELTLCRGSQQELILIHKDGAEYHFNHAVGTILRLSKMQDAYGNTVQFLYDRGRLKWVMLSDQRLIQVETERRRITGLTLCDAQRNPLRVLARYTYDRAGRLITVRGHAGGNFDYQYNKAGHLTRWQDLAHTWVEHDYDDQGRAIASRCADGLWHDQIRYDDANHIHYYKSAFGGIETFHLDERNLPTAIVDADGNRTEQQWKGDLLVSETNALGETTAYTHDAWGNVTSVTLPDDTVHLYQYNEQGWLTSYTDPLGASWTYAHNPQGDVVQVTDPENRTWQSTYTPQGLRDAVTGPDGSTTRYHYTAQGLLARVEPPVGYALDFHYDSQSRLIKRVSDNKQTRQWCYVDSQPNPSQVIYEDGTTATFQYDIEGNLIAVTNALGHTRTFAYGAFDRLKTVTDPLGATTHYHYNNEGEFAGVTNSQGHQWLYEFDTLGRIASESHYDGRTETFSYDAAGRLCQRTKPDGHHYQYQYDPCGRLLEAQSMDNNSQPTGKSWYAYDDASRLTYAENSDAWVSMAYSPAGQLLSENLNGTPLTYDYDATGKRTAFTGTQTPRAYQWQQQQLSELQLGNHDPLKFAYHQSGQEQARTSDTGFGLFHDWSPTGLLQRQSLGHHKEQPLRQYHYDALDQLTGIQDAHRGKTEFSHNANGQVSAVRQRKSWETQASFVHLFGYDSELNLNESGMGSEYSGNVVSLADERLKRETRDYDKAGRVLKTGRFTYRYDACGRVIEKTEDKAGFRPQSTQFIWNDEDRLTHIELPDGSRYRYRYDPFGRRIAKECLKTQQHTHYLWDGNTVVQQSQITADGTALKSTEYLYEPDTFRPMAQVETNHQTGRERLHYIVTDHAGTPQELCSPTGEIEWRGDQALWGNYYQRTTKVNRGYREEAANDVIHCDLRYQGQLEDTESGLYYNLNRYYDADSGQYLSPDPIGMVGGIRPQGYVENPVGWVDPLGLATCAVGTLNKVKNQGYSISAAQRQEIIDSIDNSKLKSIFSEMYRPGAAIGDGGTASSIVHTKVTGELVGGSDHVVKGEGYMKALKNLVSGKGKYKSEILSGSDRSLASHLIGDLKSALEL